MHFCLIRLIHGFCTKSKAMKLLEECKEPSTMLIRFGQKSFGKITLSFSPHFPKLEYSQSPKVTFGMINIRIHFCYPLVTKCKKLP